MKLGGYKVHPAAEHFPLIEGKEFKALVEDIRKYGLRDSILLIQEDGETWLLDGRNRLRACIEAEIEPHFDYFTEDDPFEYVWSTNDARRHMEPGQRVAVRLAWELARDQWQERQQEKQQKANEARSEAAKGQPRSEGGTFSEDPPVGGNVAPDPSEAEAERESRKTRSELASAAGVGARTAQKALTVRKERPDLDEMVRSGRMSLNAAYRKLQKDKTVAKLRAEPMPLPEGPFRVLMADPAWMYEKNREGDGTQRGQTPYTTMTIAEICALGEQVQQVAYVDCVLWLWITNAHLLAGVQVEVLKAWGFVGKTILTWRKPKMGTGDWLRGKTEHCIMAVRGNPTIDLTNQTTDFCIDGDEGYYFEAPVGEHSEKPDEFYEFVEELCPGSKLEMFSRKGRPDWQAWGAEAGKLDAAAVQ